MSESTIPFQGQTAVLDRPPTEFETEPESGGRRTKLLALGGLAAALVLGVVAYFLVFAGGDEEPVASAPKPGSAAPEAPVVAEPAAPATQPKISNKNFGRDPFKALITEPEVAPATGVAATTGGSTTTGDTTSGGTTTGGTTTGGTSAPAESTSHTFKVVDVAPDNSAITVKVDGVVYRNLKAGEVFATYFKVRLISGPVNSFQYGEETFNVSGNQKLTIA